MPTTTLTGQQLADALRSSAATDPMQAAAVDILLGLPHLHDRDDIRGYIVTGDAGTYVDWPRLAADLRAHRVPVSSGERRMLLIACSLGSVLVEVNLAQMLTGLDVGNAALLSMAVQRIVLGGCGLDYDREDADLAPAGDRVPDYIDGWAITGRGGESR